MNASFSNVENIKMLKPNKSPNRWCKIYKPRPLATCRVVLLPHAGGSASFFRQWVDLFPTNIEVIIVQYPGREDRLTDALIDNMDGLVEGICKGLSRFLDKPYVLFGHSMGGGVAYELYLTLAEKSIRLPSHLVISAFEAPSCKHQGHLHKEDDALLIQELKRLDGTGVNLSDHPELADMVLLLMRNDYQMIETYQPKLQRLPIATPITLMIGDSDKELQPGDAVAWKEETTKKFEILTFQGGHFYLTQEKSAVVQALSTLCRPVSHAWPITP